MACALEAYPFDAVSILCNFQDDRVDHYKHWIASRTDAPVTLRKVSLAAPPEAAVFEDSSTGAPS